MFWNIFIELCANKGTTPTAVVQELGLGRGSVTHWKNGKRPHMVTLHKLATFFDVPVDYLLNNTAVEQSESKKEKSPPNESELFEDVIIYHRDGKTVTKRFSKEQMKMLLTMIEAVPEKNEET